jgi:hypothetical protein
MRAALALALVAAACHRDAGPPPPVHELWALAPAATTEGLAIDGPTLDAARETLRRLRDALATSPHPELATALTELVSANDIQLLSDKSLRNAGVDLSRGAALFTAGDAAAGAVRIVNERRFRRAAPGDIGTCDDRGPLSLCSRDPALLVPAAKPSTVTELLRRPPAMSGGLEVVRATPSGPIAIAADVSRGRVDLRIRMVARDVPAMPALRPHPLTRYLDGVPATAVIVADFRDVVAVLAPNGLGDSPWAVLRGDFIAAGLRGDTYRAWFRVGVRDEASARALLARCEELELPSNARGTRRGDACEVALPVDGGTVSVVARADGDTLLVETAPGVAAERGDADPHIARLVAEPVLFASWGRGVGSTPALPDEVGGYIKGVAPWVFAHIDELGTSVRLSEGIVELGLTIGTVWQDSDPVLAELEPLLAGARIDASQIAAVAAKHPQSRLAADVAAGTSGLRTSLSIVTAVAQRAMENLAAVRHED